VVPGAKVGPTFLCILVDQFKRLRDGDRFFYENPDTFSVEQLTEIKKSSLSRVLCDDGDNIEQVTVDAFTIPGKQGGYRKCKNIERESFEPWIDAEGCSLLDEKSSNRKKRSKEPESEKLKKEVKSLESKVNFLSKKIKRLENKCSDAKNTTQVIEL